MDKLDPVTFVCIKPNIEKVPGDTDLKSSMQQLRYAGVVAAVPISRVAFPNRLPHETALARFGCLTTISSDGKQPKTAHIFSLMHILLSEFKGEGKKTVDEDSFAYRKSRV